MLVEEAGFPPVLDLLDTVGAEVVPIAVDAHGPVPEALQAALARRPVAVYLQPRAHNPLGVSIGVRRAKALAELLAPTGAWVFEDDHAGDISTSPLVSLGRHLPARTVLVQSFSKSFGPDLRLAAVGGPDDLLGELVARRLLGAGWSSRLLQGVLLELLADPATAETLAEARADVREAPRRPHGRAARPRDRYDRPGRDQPVGRGGRRAGRAPTASPPAASASPSARRSCRPAPARDHVRITSGLLPRGGRAAGRPRGRGRRAPDPAHPGLVSVVERPYLGCIRMAPSSRMTSPFR